MLLPRLRARALLRALLLPTLVLGWLSLAALRGGYLRQPALDRPPERRPLRARDVHVLDGDTYLVAGRPRWITVRLLGADCPEKAAPWFDGDQEPWAGDAARFSRQALDAAGRIELLSRGEEDERGRLLAHLLVDGDPLAARLVGAGLACPTVERFGEGGFPAQATEVLRRARPPAFEPPWRWRRAHRRP